MISLTVLIILIPFVLLHFIKKAFKKPENFPPGPPSLPVWGGYPYILWHSYSDLAASFLSMGKKYKTKMVGLFLGPIPAVVVNDPVLVKEVLNREDFDGRLDTILGRLRYHWQLMGIFFTDGYYWHVQRRFSLRYLRDFGFGRRDESLEDVVANEIKEMLDMRLSGPKYPVEKSLVNGELVLLPYFLTVPFINGVLYVFTKTTFPRSEYDSLVELLRHTVLFQKSSNDIGRALVITPWLKDIVPKFSGYSGLVKGNTYILNFLSKVVQEAVDTYDETRCRHFLDVYISKMMEEKKQNDRTTFSVDQLVMTCVDFMFPASSAVQNTIAMVVDRMLRTPGVQEKIHEEIDRVVGRGRLPHLDDRKNMPYLEACLREGMRIDTLVPLGLPHRAIRDTKLDGYDVPEGSMVSVNYIPLHMDKQLWGDPEEFRPERFITDGKLNLSLDKTLPFGAGRRLCAGETYARNTMFLVFAAFMQAFHVTTHDGAPRVTPDKIKGIITIIPDFWVRVTPRN